MRALLRIIDTLCAAGAAVAATACLALAVMLIVEVILTSFFQYSQPWAVEYSGYLLAATLFAGAGWTLGQGGHIRVAALIALLPPGAFRATDLAASVFALGVSGFVTMATTENALRSLELGSRSYYPTATPLWIPQMVLAAGWLCLSLGLVARILRLLADLPTETRADAPADEGGE